MKRYHLDSAGRMSEFAEGDYVLYSDVMKLPSPPRSPATSYSLLRLNDGDRTVYFVIEERSIVVHDDITGHREYLYEEHSCPSDFLRDCVAVIEDGDEDPHGLCEFVRCVEVAPGSEPPSFREMFPEAFSKSRSE